MKLPCLSVRASLTVLNPSRINETSAPASGLPRLSRTVPLMVASDLLEPAPSVSLVIKDTSAMRDKLKPNALLMRQRPPAKVPIWKPWTKRAGSERRRTLNPQNKPLLSVTAQINVKLWCLTRVGERVSTERDSAGLPSFQVVIWAVSPALPRSVLTSTTRNIDPCRHAFAPHFGPC